jgi:hypothetical protein
MKKASALPDFWHQTASFPGFSGEGAMQAAANDGTNTTSGTNGPALEYSVYFQTTGTYTVHVRGLAPDPYTLDNSSVRVGLNGAQVTTSGCCGINSFTATGFAWRTRMETATPTTTTITIPTPGFYTLTVWMREDGVVIDKLWLTTNGAAVTDGSSVLGPAESAPLAFVESGGSVVMEAENFIGQVAGSGAWASTAWAATTSYSGYTGAGAMHTPDNTTSNTGLDAAGPALLYTVQFSTPGTYYVFVRGRGPDGDSDSVHVGREPKQPGSCARAAREASQRRITETPRAPACAPAQDRPFALGVDSGVRSR